MHEDGEVDIRGVYCIASVAKLVNIDTSPSSQLFAGSASWVASCQSYEGGFSAVPFTEAHGGYAFCGWAALNLLDRTYLCETESLLNWLISRQMAFEVMNVERYKLSPLMQNHANICGHRFIQHFRLSSVKIFLKA